jgi:hypothetical protein
VITKTASPKLEEMGHTVPAPRQAPIDRGVCARDETSVIGVGFFEPSGYLGAADAMRVCRHASKNSTGGMWSGEKGGVSTRLLA